MSGRRKITFKRILKSPISLVVLVVLFFPVVWLVISTITIGSYALGISNHLGASRGYVTSYKVSNFVTLPFEKIDLSYGYGSRIFWVSEGSEIYLNYSAVNYGSDSISFAISNHSVFSPGKSQFTSAKVENTASGTVYHRAENSGFYNVRIIPRKLISSQEDISYRFKFSWGVRSPTQ